MLNQKQQQQQPVEYSLFYFRETLKMQGGTEMLRGLRREQRLVGEHTLVCNYASPLFTLTALLNLGGSIKGMFCM